MHRWDSQLNPPPNGAAPIAWGDTAVHGITHGQLRGPHWRRSTRGLYVPAAIPLDPQQRIAEAAALLPDFGAIGGWAAAYWRGVRLLDGRGAAGHQCEAVLLHLGPAGKIRQRPLVELSREHLDTSEIEELRGLPCTTAARTAFDGARKARHLYGAVVFLDMMLTAGLVKDSELATYWATHPGWKGLPQARRALFLAQRGSRSPPETNLRLLWVVEAGLPRPLVNPPVFSRDGQLLGYPDLLDGEAGTALEYDGDDHRDPRQHSDDNVREERFEEHGLLVCRVGRLDMRYRRQLTRERVVRTRARGLARTAASTGGRSSHHHGGEAN